MADSFNALQLKVEDVKDMVKRHGELKDWIFRAGSKLRNGLEGFTPSIKEDVAESLEHAEECLRALCDTTELRAEIANAQGLLATAAAYVPPARAPHVEKKAYAVIRAYGLSGRNGVDTYQIRMYADSDPRGKYQEWNRDENTFTKTLTEKEALNGPFPPHAQWTMSAEECKAAGLQAHLAQLKLLSTA
jgi:hypothetical protein